MKYSSIRILILAVLGVIRSQAEEALPQSFNFDRYSKMVDHSPFAVATEVAAPAATPNFAKDLYIANAARSSDGDMVTLASSSDKEFKKYLTTREPVDGYAIANIEWSEKVGETKVTISKDGQFATLTFNQAVLSQQMPNRPAPPAPGAFSPGQQPSFGPKPGQNPGVVAAPTPHVRATIQRNPQQPQYTPVPRTPPPGAEE